MVQLKVCVHPDWMIIKHQDFRKASVTSILNQIKAIERNDFFILASENVHNFCWKIEYPCLNDIIFSPEINICLWKLK